MVCHAKIRLGWQIPGINLVLVTHSENAGKKFKPEKVEIPTWLVLDLRNFLLEQNFEYYLDEREVFIASLNGIISEQVQEPTDAEDTL